MEEGVKIMLLGGNGEDRREGGREGGKESK